MYTICIYTCTYAHKYTYIYDNFMLEIHFRNLFHQS